MPRIVSYQQTESSDCGITCIRIIARYYGKKVPLSTLRELCNPGRLGITLKDILDCTTAIGFYAKAIKVTEKEIQRMPLPAVLYWEQSHYVVLYKIDKKRRYYVVDPSFGKMRFSYEEFMKFWKADGETGLAVVLSPTDAFYKSEFPKESINLSLLGLLKGSIHSNRFSFCKILALMSIVLAAETLSPIIFQQTIDEGIGNQDINLVWILVFGRFALFLGSYMSNNLIDIILTKMGLKLGIKLIKEYLGKLINLPISFFDAKVSSDLIQKIDDQNRIKNFLVNTPDALFVSFINLIIFSGLLLYYSYVIFLIFLIFGTMSLLWTKLFLRKRRELDYSLFSFQSKNRNNIYELVYGMADIKINNAQFSRVAVWNRVQERINDLSNKKAIVDFYAKSGDGFIIQFKEILVTGLCASFVVYGDMTIGVMMTVSYLVGRLSQPIRLFSQTINRVQDATLSYERINEIINYQDNFEYKKNYDLSYKSITINDLSFKYTGSYCPLVLKNINIIIPRGKVTAIVGASGSGKSTILKLLLGFYKPTSGSVLIGETPLDILDQDCWLRNCGAVMQSGFIFSGSIKENISLSRSDKESDLDKVISAAKVAGIDDFISSLAMSYNTKIGSTGLELSGGQKQRLFIARAICDNPEYLFFDEATSSLDANNERAVMEHLERIFQNKTVVVVAHRLSTVKNADNIIVLDNGQVVEQGTHNELTKKRGYYFELVKNQLELGD